MSAPHSGKRFWKKAAQWLVILVITIGLGEVVARCYGEPGRLSWMLEKNKKIITFMGLPQLNETMEYDSFLFWRLKKNLNNFHVTGQLLDHYLDFSISTRNHLRTSSLPTAEHGKTIVALGDSCTFGVGVNDQETWPAQLQLLLNQQGVKATIINAGVPGYSAFQGKRFLEKNMEQLNPDLVIACFGFNDREPWKGLSDIEVARRIKAGQQEPLFKSSRLYLFSRYVAQNIVFKVRHYSSGIGPRGRLSEQEYRETIQEIKNLCDQKGINLICMLWPYQMQVLSRSDALWFYQKHTADICEQEQIECVNLISPFIEEKRPLYLDHIHANPTGCRLAAQTLLVPVLGSPTKGHVKKGRTQI